MKLNRNEWEKLKKTKLKYKKVWEICKKVERKL